MRFCRTKLGIFGNVLGATGMQPVFQFSSFLLLTNLLLTICRKIQQNNVT